MHRAGYSTVAACEVEAWRRALYSENNPHVRMYDDVRTLTADRLLADLGRLPAFVVGSPPCQDISSANTKGRGVEGERSGLYFEAVRIIGECRPRWFALENSANLRTRGADAVVAALEAIGYTCWPCVVRAGDIDANHERPRAWLIGCDLAQVTDPDGERWNEGRRWGRSRLDASVPANPCDAPQDGCGPGFPRRRFEPAERLSEQACGDAPHADHQGELCGAEHAEVEVVRGLGRDSRGNPGDASNADQAGQADGCVESRLRQAEIADDGRGVGWGDDGSIAGQVGVRAADRGAAFGHRADWSLADLADHLRLDDGLSARLAGHRVDIGDGKGQSAASLIVEAFGDAVIPQIPEAIGRAIWRVEAALRVILLANRAA
uniref:DNA cytosine methyltransferase n=1 Tax=uncultured Sphingomonas sp. TaxID=158754 RepID=UPI0035CB5FBF